ncbi:MAG: Mut7-C RNAse domain-containing protein [Anaerolineales bacterium]
MKHVRFEFAPSLRSLLARDLRDGLVDLCFTGPQTAKHLIESLGIPHTEIGEVRLDGKTVGLGYLVHDGDRLEVGAEMRAGVGEGEPRFVLDGHLGRLASHLRMLGLDCLYDSEADDEELAQVSAEEGRILLTRDRRLLMRKIVMQGFLLRSLVSHEQLREVVERYELWRWVKPFQRCLRCNHPLEAVSKEAVLERLEPLTKRYFDEFRLCPACNQVYWKGSHYERMLTVIKHVTGNK